jgi:hypothetical protein
MIYALVLTAPGRTIHHVSEGYLEYHAKNTVTSQANGNLDNDSELAPQNSILLHDLKGVCKELYEETKSLRLKFNPKIMFSSHSEDQVPATELFLGFFATLSAEQRQLVREVELCSGVDACDDINITCCVVDDGKQLLFHLADVCRYNPHINVKYRLTCFNRMTSPTAYHIIYTGVMKNVLLRRNCIGDALGGAPVGHDFPTTLRGYLSGRTDQDVPLREREVARLAVPNLRFFPMADILYDAYDLLFTDFGSFYDENGRDLMPSWEQWANKWLSEGF